jgi:hypothetical protein
VVEGYVVLATEPVSSGTARLFVRATFSRFYSYGHDFISIRVYLKLLSCSYPRYPVDSRTCIHKQAYTNVFMRFDLFMKSMVQIIDTKPIADFKKKKCMDCPLL